MNILLDFCTLYVKSGAGEYIRRIYKELLHKIESMQGWRLFALYDSVKGIAYEDMSEKAIGGAKDGITYIDIHGKDLFDITKQYAIDRFFIGCEPCFYEYAGIEKIECEVIMVVHDICSQELLWNNIFDYEAILYEETMPSHRFSFKFLSKLNKKRHAYYLGKGILNRENSQLSRIIKSFDCVVELLHKNSKAKLVAVSNYTKSTILYNYDIPADRIQVLYSPSRVYEEGPLNSMSHHLYAFIENKRKYFLLVSGSNANKNSIKAVRAFERYRCFHPDIWLVIIGYRFPVNDDHVIVLPFLDDNELLEAYKHCYALLYPSFFEGFGYPPLEVMRFGKPVLSSNVTSMPEILGDAPIYFSPLYESDIFRAMSSLTEDNYKTYSQKSLERYNAVSVRQQQDLDVILGMLTV